MWTFIGNFVIGKSLLINVSHAEKRIVIYG
jgi:hypothetical protein